MDIVQFFALIILVLCAIRGPKALFSFALIGLNFSAFAILPPSIIGGATITPTSLGFAVLFCSIVARAGAWTVLSVALDFERLGFLTFYVAWCIISAIFLPRLFAGEMLVYTVQPIDGGFPLAPLSYTNANVTQVAYVILSYLVTLSTFMLSGDPSFPPVFLNCLKILALLISICGLLDLVGLGFVLAIFRNANYALVGETQIGAARRVVGATTEPSAFGGLSAWVFATFLILRSHFRSKKVWFLGCALSLGFAVLSASSTAFAMIAVTGFVFVFQQVVNMTIGSEEFFLESLVALLGAFILFSVIVLTILAIPNVSAIAWTLIDELVLNKSSSLSFEERSRWTNAAYQAFTQSKYLGVGIGSCRSSNALVNILASTGLIGSALLLFFVVKIYVASTGVLRVIQEWNIQLILLPLIVGLYLAGTTPDYGPIVAVMFGLQLSINVGDFAAKGGR